MVRNQMKGKGILLVKMVFGNVRYSMVIQTTLTPELLVTNQFFNDPSILLFYL